VTTRRTGPRPPRRKTLQLVRAIGGLEDAAAAMEAMGFLSDEELEGIIDWADAVGREEHIAGAFYGEMAETELAAR